MKSGKQMIACILMAAALAVTPATAYCATPMIAAKTASKSSAYILPDSSSKYLTASDLKGLDKSQLRLARNEIYARHGRKFSDSTLQNYFNGKSWYSGTIAPDQFKESSLNKYEAANVKLIKQAEDGKLNTAVTTYTNDDITYMATCYVANLYDADFSDIYYEIEAATAKDVTFRILLQTEIRKAPVLYCTINRTTLKGTSLDMIDKGAKIDLNSYKNEIPQNSGLYDTGTFYTSFASKEGRTYKDRDGLGAMISYEIDGDTITIDASWNFDQPGEENFMSHNNYMGYQTLSFELTDYTEYSLAGGMAAPDYRTREDFFDTVDSFLKKPNGLGFIIEVEDGEVLSMSISS